MRTFSSITREEAIEVAKLIYPPAFMFEDLSGWTLKHCTEAEDDFDGLRLRNSWNDFYFDFDTQEEAVQFYNLRGSDDALEIPLQKQWQALTYLWSIGIVPKWCNTKEMNASGNYFFFLVNWRRALTMKQRMTWFKETSTDLPHPEVLQFCREYVEKFDHQSKKEA